jgi:hypothetical protein
VPQVDVSEKVPAVATASVMLGMLSALLPVLVSVTVWAAVATFGAPANVSDVAVNVAVGCVVPPPPPPPVLLPLPQPVIRSASTREPTTESENFDDIHDPEM